MFTVFISATSDIKPLRDMIYSALKEASVHVIVQDESLGKAPKDVRDLLASDIEQSTVVIHIAGDHYGADAGEPAFPPFPELPDFCCSWTQFEYYYAHVLDKDVYAFVMAPELPRKHLTADELQQRQTLQQAHRDRVISGKFDGTPVPPKPRTMNDRHQVKDDLDMMSRLAGVVRRGQQDWGGAKDKITVELIELTRGIAKLRQLSELQAAQLERVLSAIEHDLKPQLDQIESATTETRKRSGWLLAAVPLLIALLLAVGLVAAPQSSCRLPGMATLCGSLGLDQSMQELADVGRAVTDVRLEVSNVSRDVTDLKKSLSAIAAEIRAESGAAIPAVVVSSLVAEENAALAQQRAATDHANTQTQRDVSESLNNIGQIKAVQGDAAGALAAYERSLQIRETLALEDPSSAQARRDVSVSLDNVGTIKAAQGDAIGAWAAYQRSLQIRETLALGDPSSAQAQRDLSVSLDNVGNIKAAQGDYVGALAAYQRSLQIRERLVLLDNQSAYYSSLCIFAMILDRPVTACIPRSANLAPSSDSNSAQAGRDFAVSLGNVGRMKAAQGDSSGALAAYQRMLEITESLALADPSSALAQRDVSVSLDNVGNIKATQGDAPDGLAVYQRSLKIREALARADPSNAQAQRDVAVSHVRLWQVATERRVEIHHAREVDRIFTTLDANGAHISPADRQAWKQIQSWLQQNL